MNVEVKPPSMFRSLSLGAVLVTLAVVGLVFHMRVFSNIALFSIPVYAYLTRDKGNR